MWQDILILVGSFILTIALLPSIFSSNKPARSTCAISGTVLASYVVAFATLGLSLSAVGTGLCSLAWFILLIQRRETRIGDIWRD